jgi:hypothetical protein
VAVIVDEADAAVGNRGDSGDAGTSARVFAQLAAQMGNTRYRGKLIWFLLTCRPDLLPVDLKRQGRCEEHIPLFYPQSPAELREMFVAMARKAKVDLDESPARFFGPAALSGADIEAILTRARPSAPARPARIRDFRRRSQDLRSTRGPAHELQLLAGILECTDLLYCPRMCGKPPPPPRARKPSSAASANSKRVRGKGGPGKRNGGEQIPTLRSLLQKSCKPLANFCIWPRRGLPIRCFADL